MIDHTWQNYINHAPRAMLTEVENGSIVFLDTKDDHPAPGHPDHKFRPVLVFNGGRASTMNVFANLVDRLGDEADYAMYFVPLTTQHRPKTQPLHISHTQVDWEHLLPSDVNNKTSYFDANNAFAITEKDLYYLEDHDQDLHQIPLLAKLSPQQQKAFDQSAYENILAMEQTLNPRLQTQNRLQRERWHQRYGSHGGENPLVASYRKAHPHTERFQRPALNRPPQSPSIDDGPDL